MKILLLALHLGMISALSTTLGYTLVVNTDKVGDDVLVKERRNLSTTIMECRSDLLLKPDDFSFHENGTIYIVDTKRILKQSEFFSTIDGNLCIIENGKDVVKRSILECGMFSYEPKEYEILPNGSALLYGTVLAKGSFKIENGNLKRCVDDYSSSVNVTIPKDITEEALIYVGQVGASISIISLTIHLLIFALLPARRNLPSSNLASLSLAFLFGYFFLLFGQIESILDISCIVSASLQHFFFLSAFFWMNIISFDVWRSLRLATNNFIVPSGKSKKLRFLCYSIYAWGIPLWLAVTAVITNFSDKVSDDYKPLFGRDNICWFTNDKAKFVYFGIPVIVLLISNTIFFVMSAVMIVNNTMSGASAQQRTAKRNVALYFRLALVMGVVWLTAIAGMVFQQKELWFAFDALNSLQGFFVFVFFSFNTVWHIFKTEGRRTSRDSVRVSALKNSTTRPGSEIKSQGK